MKKLKNSPHNSISTKQIKTSFDEFNQDEIEVSNVLNNMLHLISQSSLIHLNVSSIPSWGRKRRRSAVDKLLPPPSTLVVTVPGNKTSATSPDTPLAFFHSESDAKSKPQTKKLKTPAKKKTREELRQILDERKQTQQTLLREIEKMKLHLMKLKAENQQLKAKKHKAMGIEGTGLELVDDGSNPKKQHIQQQEGRICTSTTTQSHHQQPWINPHHQNQSNGLVINPTAEIESNIGFELGFDLNVSAEENGLQPLDQDFVRNVMMNRAIVAHSQAKVARQKRMQIRANKFSRVKP